MTMTEPAPDKTSPERRRTPFSPLVGERTPVDVDTSEPVLPEWLRDRLTFLTTARNFVRRNGYRARKQLLYLPGYIALLLAYSPRGAGRLIAAAARFLYDAETKSLQHAHAGNTETKEYTAVERARKDHLHARWIVVGVLTGLVVALGVTWTILDALDVLPFPPAWATWTVLVGGWLALGWHGRNLTKPFTKTTQLAAGIVEPLRAPVVAKALCDLGNSRMKDPNDIRLLMDVARVGPGYQVDLELPSVPATYVIGKREELAAALRRELGTVWPAVGKRNAAHLSLYVCDQPMVEAAQKPWPLMKDGTVDVFKPVPMFTDQKGEWIDLTFAYANMVIGALPRMGKTFLLRQVLLALGLDVRTRVYALDGKGTGDLSPCALFAHFYSVGDEPEEIERVLHAFRALRDEMRRRARLIREMPREECPESKVTSVLANRPGLEPIVLGIDETQAYFEYGDPKNKADKAIREELIAIVTDLVKRGPALGFIVLLATQNVTKDTIPTSISNNAVIRACLKIFGQDPNDRVLGTGSYRQGIDATQFATEDRGIVYLRAEGAHPQIARTVFGLDAVRSEKVAVRARQLREEADRLTGDANDEVMEREEQQVILLDDVREVMDADRAARMHLGPIRDRLALLRPGIYGHLDVPALGSMLRQAGVEPATVWAAGKDGKGVKREWLNVAATEQIGDADEDGGGNVIDLTGRR